MPNNVFFSLAAIVETISVGFNGEKCKRMPFVCIATNRQGKHGGASPAIKRKRKKCRRFNIFHKDVDEELKRCMMNMMKRCWTKLTPYDFRVPRISKCPISRTTNTHSICMNDGIDILQTLTEDDTSSFRGHQVDKVIGHHIFCLYIL